MKEDWREMVFVLIPYRETVSRQPTDCCFGFTFFNFQFRLKNVKILSSVDEIQVLLDDHIIRALTMLGSPFIKPMEVEMRVWTERLQMIQDILDEWLKVTKQVFANE